MMMIDGMRYQLLGELVGKGFIKSLDESSSKASRADVVRSVMVCVHSYDQGMRHGDEPPLSLQSYRISR
jgi:hypothetical protein